MPSNKKQPKPFSPDQFAAVEYGSAEDKAKFANHLARFVESGFNPNLFPDWFYRRLLMTFGHIAHFNKGGFYSVWFRKTQSRRDFLCRIVDPPWSGGPWGDVERALATWVIENDLVRVHDELFRAEVEDRERAELARLKAKYPEAA